MLINDLFLHDDFSKPENRINISLFGMLAVPAFRYWLLQRLALPATSVLYPPVNWREGGVRPDFVVKDATTDQALAWVEVECGRDDAQVARFRRLRPERVIALWGRPGPGADLSLSEIAVFLVQFESAGDLQVRYNAAHLRQLIEEALQGRQGTSYKPAVVSAAMRQTPFVRGLEAALGPRLSYDLSDAFRPGTIRANTLAESGYSLRVYSSVARARSLSICNFTGGRPQLWFPSQVKCRKYLPRHHEAVELLVDLVQRMGGDMTSIEPNGKTWVPLERAVQHVDMLADIVMQLAT